MKGNLAGMLAVCLTGLPLAGAVCGEPQPRIYTYEVELDASGALLSATPLRNADDATTRQLQAELRNWTFRPAQQDGHSARTSTWVRMTAIPASDGGPARVLSATAGPVPDRLRNPEFPEAAQVRGQQGVVVLKLAIDAQGRVQSVDVHDTVGRIDRAMANAAIAAARGWTFRPERVDGAPLASLLLMPVCFVASADSEACAWKGPQAQTFDRDTVLALDPVVRLAEPVAYLGR